MKFFICLFFLTYAFISSGQFSGGNGEGSFRASGGFRLLNGSGDIPLFTGGNGRGDGNGGVGKLLRITLNGSPDPLHYPGGGGHGSTGVYVPYSSLSGQNPFAFPGGTGDGSSGNISVSISLNGENRNPNLDFRGGNGNGSFRSLSGEVFLTGISVNASLTYFGGNGNGSSRSQSLKDIVLSGSFYNHPFPGGFGRGDRTLKSSRITLNGILAPASVRIAQSAIRDFYHVPDFEPKKARLLIDFHPENQLKGIILQQKSEGFDFFSHSKTEFENGSPQQLEIPVDLKAENQIFRVLQIFSDSSRALSDQISVDALPAGTSIFAYPNPASDYLILATNTGETVGNIELFDIRGRQLNCPSEGLMNGSFRIDVSALKSGLYSLVISGSTGTESLRFSKK